MNGRWNCGECTLANRRGAAWCRWCGHVPSARIVSRVEDRPVWTLGLSTRSFNAVTADWARARRLDPEDARKRMALADLIAYTPGELLALRLFGFGCLDEVRQALEPLGLELAGSHNPIQFEHTAA
jgi:hypothetical protein